MKRFLLLAMMAILLAVTTSANVLAQEEECPCGVDEEGQCIPCEDAE